jgi:hypothetical protein
VHYHNINGRIPDTVLARVSGGDGVVTLESAHLDNIDSEIIVPAEHSILHRHPLSVLEVRRILLEHAANLRAAPAGPLQTAPWTAGAPLPPAGPPLPAGPALQVAPPRQQPPPGPPSEAANRAITPYSNGQNFRQ